MKQAILLSIKPEWIEKIRSGKKTREIRKNKPSCQLPISVYMYCTKDTDNYKWLGQKECEGKVVGKFTLKEVEIFDPLLGHPSLYIAACMGDFDSAEYANGKKFLFAWHISDLVIFDEPKELCDFHPYFPKLERWCHEDSDCDGCPFFVSELAVFTDEDCKWLKGLTKAPQSWQYVEVRP